MKPRLIHQLISRCFIFLVLVWTALYIAGCSGCSRSGSHQPRRNKRSNIAKQPAAEPVQKDTTTPKPTLTQLSDGPTEVAMEKENGVYKIPVEINGLPLKFILDTGASLISISATEAEFMFKQGVITEDDIIGKSKFQDANGDISPGSIIRLKSVRIGDRVLENVSANVVSSTKAPLLLGQSALSKFGKISVDYRRNIVTFD
ncbi:retroviral-like aspartic protease family protein [Spirosoma sp. BT702]|uniref:Retroviral-like aspartic protease family protein n=1 Tax=Spirosoma profusum TaxID=2771354 RepID=A0A927AUI5_9BACT|nr:retropepsin-like aspartic protease [Spirosoma profusum]MBD2704487.1 retroviral-like aspartic protease family protein [Spirosoma profusum]